MDKSKSLLRMKELVELLNRAGRAYYQEAREIMSNKEYDALYDELLSLEQETGTVRSDSPTQNVGYKVVSELPKERHESPMLSLDKTKDRETLKSWLGGQKGYLSWKLDGLTIVLTYEDGELKKAVTRGNGETGEIVTNNAKVFKNVPLKIPYKGNLVVRGEALIRYSDFEKVNQGIEEEAKYKNPRNLCSGTVRQLNNQITAERNVNFFAFQVIGASDVDFKNSKKARYDWLASQGFDVVFGKEVEKETILPAIEWFSEEVKENDLPSDGLVLTYDDIAYSASLGRTAKFPKDSIAFKWQDEVRETTLLEMEWSASRTGLINPVAIFEPVELEGTSVSRASVHNVSIVEDLELGIGDTITVYKANMIIPQIAQNLTRSGNLSIPEKCPVCGQPTKIRMENEVRVLVCENKDCLAKKIKKFTLFVSRDAMNVDGLSEATIEKMIAKGFIHEYADLFHLDRYQDEIVNMEGFGKRSYEKLQKSIDQARKTVPARLLYALGVANIGLSNARLICQAFDQDIERIRHLTEEELVEIEKIGPVIAKAFTEYFKEEKHQKALDALLKELDIEKEAGPDTESSISGKVFVITGSLEHFANRNELKAYIESKGGKVTGSVSARTDYLINNDASSGSSKNKKAKELGIPILTEEDFLAL